MNPLQFFFQTPCICDIAYIFFPFPLVSIYLENTHKSPTALDLFFFLFIATASITPPPPHSKQEYLVIYIDYDPYVF